MRFMRLKIEDRAGRVKRHFVVRHQLDTATGWILRPAAVSNSLWSRSGSYRPELYHMTDTFKALFSPLYTEHDIAFHSLFDKGTDMYRFVVGPDQVHRKLLVHRSGTGAG